MKRAVQEGYGIIHVMYMTGTVYEGNCRIRRLYTKGILLETVQYMETAQWRLYITSALYRMITVQDSVHEKDCI